MKRVIKHGYNKFTTTCYNCLCFFEYELKEIDADHVSCPDCGNKCAHIPSHWVVGSQIEEKENESDID